MKREFKALIVEDTSEVSKLIQIDLSRLGNITVEAIAETFEEAEKILYTAIDNFNISILDARIDNKYCYELIEKFDRQLFGIIVFVTAYGDRPTKELKRKIGLHIELEKPINSDDWQQLSRYLNWHITEVKNIDQHISDKLIPLDEKADGVGGWVYMEDHEIVAIESVKNTNYTIVHCIDANKKPQKLKSTLRLREFGQLRIPPRFKRIHKQYILNMDYLYRFIELRGSKIGYVLLKIPFELTIPWSKEYVRPRNRLDT